MAELGAPPVVLIRCWRISAAPPAISGVECEVPLEAVVHSCVVSQKLLPGPAHTWDAMKQESASPFGLAGGLARWPAAWNTPPETWVPAAIRSGFLRPSV